MAVDPKLILHFDIISPFSYMAFYVISVGPPLYLLSIHSGITAFPVTYGACFRCWDIEDWISPGIDAQVRK